MKSLNLYSLFSLLIFCALSLSSGIAQKGDTIFQLTQRSEENFYADYKDYTGRAYSANKLSYLQEQSSQLDGSGHEGFLIAPYNLITSFTGINDALFDVAVSGMSAEKYLLVYVYYVDSQGLTPDFRVKIKNPDLNQEDIPGMEYYLAGVMKAYGEEAISVPDQLGKGIETYLDMIDSEAVVKINYSALGAGGSDEVRPHFELTDNSSNATYTFVTPAGIPIVIPSGAFVRFYEKTEEYAGALHSFMFPNEEGAQYYMPLTYAISSDTVVHGEFAGYGYKDESKPRGFNLYSYASYVQNGVCGYTNGEVVDLLFGYTQNCTGGGKWGEANLIKKLYRADWQDRTDPVAFYHGLPAHRGAGLYRSGSVLENQTIKELQGWCPCRQETVYNPHNNLQKFIPYPCWVKREIGESIRRANLSNPDDYLFIRFEDGQEGVLAIKGNDIYLSYVNNSGEIELLKHDQFYGWMYADFEEATFSGDISKILEWAGDLAVAAGITGAFIAVNAALAGALTPAAAAYGVEAGAILLVDMTVAGAEAGVVYAVTGDSDQAVATFVGGTVGAVGGTILSQAFKGYRAIGYSDDLDAMLKVYRPGTQGQASDLMTVSLKSAKDQMEQAGLDAQAIDQVFREMEKSDELGRFILEDPTRAKALKYASDAYPDREWCTDGCTFLRALDDQLKSAGPDLEYFFKNNPDGVRAWEVLDDVGVTNLGTKIDDIEFVDGFLKNAPTKNTYELVSDINNIGGHGTWKEAVTTYSTKIDNGVRIIQLEELFGNNAATFLDSEYRTVLTNIETTAYRAFGGNAKAGGTFVTTKSGATREELALLDEWNNSMRFEAEISIPTDTKLNIGKVGPQTSTDGAQTLDGGGEQVILPFQWDLQWITKITDSNTGTVYNSIDEFAIDFPNLVN